MTRDEPSLLIMSGVQGDPRRYRTFHLYEQARLMGLNCQLSHVTDPELRKKAQRSTIVILHRAPFDAQIAWLEKEIHRKGGILIHDLDDLIFDPDAVQYIHSPDFSDPVRRSMYQEDVRLNRKTLDSCDYAITSSEYLAERVRQLGKSAFVHRNAFSMEMQACAEQAYLSGKIEPGKIVIGYASGTPTHDQDFALIKPALRSVLSHHPNVELWLVGRLNPGKDWGSMEGRIKKIDFVPWRKLPEIQSQFTINLAPLQLDNPFGESKSEIKYLEAALVKVPTIASPSESFKVAINHGDNGYLAKDAHEWEVCLDVLAEQADSWSNIAANAYEDVLLRYHPWVRAKEFVDTLNSISGHRFELHYNDRNVNLTDPELHQIFWSSAEFEQSPNLIQRGLYSLKYRNLQTLLKQVWIFFRRMVSPLFPYRNSF